MIEESNDPLTELKHQVEALLFAAEEARTVRWVANYLKLSGRRVRRAPAADPPG